MATALMGAWRWLRALWQRWHRGAPGAEEATPSAPQSLEEAERFWEQEALKRPLQPEEWVELARLKLKLGWPRQDATRLQEALWCWEEARWTAPPPEQERWWREEAQAYLALLGVETLPREERLAALQVARPTPWAEEMRVRALLYLFCHDSQGGPEVMESLYAEGYQRQPRWRPQTRWLFWNALTQRVGDEEERARQRENLLAHLEAHSGMASQVLVARWQRKERASLDAEETLRLLERWEELGRGMDLDAYHATLLAARWAIEWHHWGEEERALKALEQGLQQGEGIRHDWDYAEALGRMAEAAALLQRDGSWEEFWERAIRPRFAQRLTDPWLQVRVLRSWLGEGTASLRQRALSFVRLAIERLEPETDYGYGLHESLSTLLEAVVLWADLPQREEVVEQVEEMGRRLPMERYRRLLGLRCALAWGQMGRVQRGLQLVEEQAAALGKPEGFPLSHVEDTAALAAAWANLGCPDRAAQRLGEALERTKGLLPEVRREAYRLGWEALAHIRSRAHRWAVLERTLPSSRHDLLLWLAGQRWALPLAGCEGRPEFEKGMEEVLDALQRHSSLWARHARWMLPIAEMFWEHVELWREAFPQTWRVVFQGLQRIQNRELKAEALSRFALALQGQRNSQGAEEWLHRLAQVPWAAASHRAMMNLARGATWLRWGDGEGGNRALEEAASALGTMEGRPWLRGHIWQKGMGWVLEACGFSPTPGLAQICRQERERLRHALWRWP